MAKRRTEPAPEDARPQWLSTTGGGAAAGVPARGLCAVELRRSAAPATQHLPEMLQLGGPWPDVATIGRHEGNAVVLKLRAASKVHCQLALRTFHVPQRDEVHEALFLCDVSRRKTFVNGTPAFRPWHWLQDGDIVSLPADDAPGGLLELYRVRYRSLHKLPSSLVALPAGGRPGGRPAAPRPAAPRPTARRPAQRAPARPRPAGSGRGRGRGGAAPKGRGAGGALGRPFGEEILGRIIDLSYLDPPATFRVLVVHFDREHRWHHVDSNGLSTWDGDSFTDEVDLNQMHGQGLVRFADGGAAGEPQKASRKRARRR